MYHGLHHYNLIFMLTDALKCREVFSCGIMVRLCRRPTNSTESDECSSCEKCHNNFKSPSTRHN